MLHIHNDLGGFLGAKLAGVQHRMVQRRINPICTVELPHIIGGGCITLSVQSTETIDATLADYSNWLPEIPDMEIESRLPGFMSAPYDFRNPTAVNKSFKL